MAEFGDWIDKIVAEMIKAMLAKNCAEKISHFEEISKIAKEAADDGRTWLPEDKTKKLLRPSGIPFYG